MGGVFEERERRMVMKIGSIGYDHSHDERFVMDFEDGLECWLFFDH